MTYGPVDSPNMPKAIGPYSPAVRAGDFLFVAGQPGLDPSTGSIPPGGFEAEARQALRQPAHHRRGGRSQPRARRADDGLPRQRRRLPSDEPAVRRVLPIGSAGSLDPAGGAAARPADLDRRDRLSRLTRDQTGRAYVAPFQTSANTSNRSLRSGDRCGSVNDLKRGPGRCRCR